QKMHLIRMTALKLGRLIEHPPAIFGAFLVEMIAVDQLMKDQMPLRAILQIDGGDKLGKVGAIVMEIPGHPDLPFGREVDDLLIAQRAEPVLIAGRAE